MSLFSFFFSFFSFFLSLSLSLSLLTHRLHHGIRRRRTNQLEPLRLLCGQKTRKALVPIPTRQKQRFPNGHDVRQTIKEKKNEGRKEKKQRKRERKKERIISGETPRAPKDKRTSRQPRAHQYPSSKETEVFFLVQIRGKAIESAHSHAIHEHRGVRDNVLVENALVAVRMLVVSADQMKQSATPFVRLRKL